MLRCMGSFLSQRSKFMHTQVTELQIFFSKILISHIVFPHCLPLTLSSSMCVLCYYNVMLLSLLRRSVSEAILN